jgi:hypothetical protein
VREKGKLLFGCMYTADGSNFHITDEDCGPIPGDYTYVIDGDSVVFTLVSDACEDRRDGITGEWTRVG